MSEDPRSLDRSLDTPEARLGVRLRTNVSAEALQERVMETERASLASTFDRLAGSGALSTAAQIILGARRKFIAGEGKSAAYAQLLHADLGATVPNVFLVDGRALTAVNVLSDVRASDVIVLFSLRRYRRESVLLGRLFARSGGAVVVVTDSTDAPLAQVATSLIPVDTGSASYADSPTSVAAVCHLLSTLTTASAKGARRRLTARDEIVGDLRLYWDSEKEPR